MTSSSRWARLLLLALLVMAAVACAKAAAGADHAQEHGEEHAHEDEHAHGEEHAHEEEGHSHGLTDADYAAATARGEDPCASEELVNYDLPLHIASVFILLGVSLLGSLGPVAIRLSAAASPAAATAIRLGSYFGFGTMLSTAVIHMMLPAVAALTHPCLPHTWTDSYEAWAYLFVTLSILLMHLVDFIIKGYCRRHGAASHAEGGCGAAVVGAIVAADLHSSNPSPIPPPDQARAEEGSVNDGEAGACPVHGEGCHTLLKHEHGTSHTVGIYLAEAGIIFHSIMIGLTLGVTAGSGFTTLLVALCLHQFFEGLAIGSAAVDGGLSFKKIFVLGVAYSVSTPIGTAIGIGIRESFNSNATTTLYATGIFDALSTGILLYVVLVQLLTPMLTDSDWLHSRRWPMQMLAFACLYGGAAAMAVLGKWA